LRNQNLKSLLWTVAYTILLLSTITTFLPITICLLMIPVMALAVLETPLRFILYVLPAFIIAFLLAGSLSPVVLILGLFFLPAGIVMGSLHKKRKSARTVITAGTVALLFEMLICLLIATLSGFNVIGGFRDMSKTYLDTIGPLLQGMMSGEAEKLFIDAMIEMIPTLLIMMSIFWAFVTHGLGRVFLSLSGTEVSRLRPLREWMLPRSFVWIYLLVLLFNMFVSMEGKSVLGAMVTNLYPLLLFAFAIQAVSFFFFLTHTTNKGKALPFLSIIVLIFLPPAVFVYSFIGLFDVTFGLRDRFRKNK